MSDISYREYCTEDARAVFDLVSATFPHAKRTFDDWQKWTKDDYTAVVAYADDILMGVINLKRVIYHVAPGAELVAWVQHGVATSEASRGMGIGTGMQKHILEFIKGRGDMLFVYRGAETSGAYKFYIKSGMYDVASARSYKIEGLKAETIQKGLSWVSKEEFFARSTEWFSAYTQMREPLGGWPTKLDSSYLKDQLDRINTVKGGAWQFHFLINEKDNVITDYCVMAGNEQGCKLLEFTAHDQYIADDMIKGAAASIPVLTLDASPGSLLEKAALPLGATSKSREQSITFMMSRILNIESTGQKIWCDGPELDNVEVRVWTTEREGVIHKPENVDRVITLEMKEYTLSQLLNRRLSIKAAVAEERITLLGHQTGDIDALDTALAPVAWHYDYVDHL